MTTISNSPEQQFQPVSRMVYLQDGFTDQECDRIIDLGLRLPKQVATMDGGHEIQQHRRNHVAWIQANNPDNMWLNHKLRDLVRYINQEYYRYSISGLEDYQFTIYDQVSDFYHDHVDLLDHRGYHRKLSLSVQLSDPTSYTGCDLEVVNGFGFSQADRRRGSITAFPSFLLHRVTPIQQGCRYSLVIWAVGSYFR